MLVPSLRLLNITVSGTYTSSIRSNRDMNSTTWEKC